MTVLKYWDQGSGTYKTLTGPQGPTGPVGPTGATGPAGPTGPQLGISADAANLARLGSDSLIYTPATNIGRNKLLNPMFRVQQRGSGPWTVSGFMADRWNLNVVSDTTTASCAAATDVHRAGIGDDDLGPSILSIGVTGNAAAGAYTFLSQGIEDVRKLGGKTVILSFWSQSSAALNVGARLVQQFGTGGSPSAQVAVATQTVADTGTWRRFALIFTVPTIQGKTFGTNNDDKTLLQIALSSGSTNSPSLGVGVQSGTFNFWGFQLEIVPPGQTQPTPLEKIDIALEQIECMRFFQAGVWLLASVYVGAASQNFQFAINLPVRMRATPQITMTGNANANISSFTTTATAQVLWNGGASTAVGLVTVNYTVSLSADL